MNIRQIICILCFSLPRLKSVSIYSVIFTRAPPHSIEKLFMQCRSKCRNIQKPAINMHGSLSLQFTKQLVILPSYKRAVEATDCFDTRSGFRFTVHNKHMSRFKIKSSKAPKFSFTPSAVGAHMQRGGTEQTAALSEIITHRIVNQNLFWRGGQRREAKQLPSVQSSQ